MKSRKDNERSDTFGLQQAFETLEDSAEEPSPGSAPRSDTVILDRSQQAELMALRAQQGDAQSEKLHKEVVVMFTDLVGSTAYYERYGDQKGREKVLTHNALLFPLVQNWHGVIIKTIGDAIMASFDTPHQALEAAAAMQHALADYNRGVSKFDDEIHIRIALNFGGAIVQKGDLYGDVVNVAARIEHQAESDEILLSASLAAAGGGWPLEAAGEVALKGKSEPVALFRLKWRDVAPRDKPTAPLALPQRYTIIQLLSRGTIGDVYEAKDRERGKPVVVKGLHTFLANDPAARLAFLEAAQATMKLSHPGIIKILDCSPAESKEPYYVAELFKGRTLADMVAHHGAPSPLNAAMLAFLVAEIVYAAHKQGVVHGDLEPANIWVEPTGALRLSNFGFAKVTATQVAQGKSPVGTPAFCAPEQLLGKSTDVRADVYSLGALLYFLLSGRPPFDDAATMQSTVAVSQGGYVPLKQAASYTPDPLATAVHRALSIDPERRQESVPAFALQLRKYFDIHRGDPRAHMPRFLREQWPSQAKQRVKPESTPWHAKHLTVPQAGLLAALAGLIGFMGGRLLEPTPPAPDVVSAEPSLPGVIEEAQHREENADLAEGAAQPASSAVQPATAPVLEETASPKPRADTNIQAGESVAAPNEPSPDTAPEPAPNPSPTLAAPEDGALESAEDKESDAQDLPAPPEVEAIAEPPSTKFSGDSEAADTDAAPRVKELEEQ